MRKIIFNKKAAMTAAVFGVGILVQACGAGSGSGSSSSAAASGAAVVSNVTNSTLYGACASLYSAQSTGYYVVAAQYETSTDGTSVCQVAFEQSVSFSGSRLFLGPSYQQYGLSYALTTQVAVNPYDEITTSGISGGESSSDFICNPNNSITNIAYGYIQGVGLNGYFQLSTATPSNPIVVPANVSGQLYIGLNQSQGGGCMELSGYALINRCVDSGGTPHPCPAIFLQ